MLFEIVCVCVWIREHAVISESEKLNNINLNLHLIYIKIFLTFEVASATLLWLFNMIIMGKLCSSMNRCEFVNELFFNFFASTKKQKKNVFVLKIESLASPVK